MLLISYICIVKEESKPLREILYTDEFNEFYSEQDERTKLKFKESVVILESIYVLSAKFVKKLTNTDLYEMRVSVGTNEYRTMLFAVNHENIIQSTEVVLLNGFLKKSTKDYEKQIKKAIRILKNLEL